MRPADKEVCKGLKEEQMEAMSYYVISGCTREYAYGHFINTDYKMTKTAISTLSGQLFGSKEGRAYMAAYRKTLDGVISTAKEKSGKQHTEIQDDGNPEIMKKRKMTAVQKIVGYILDEAVHIKDSDDPETLVKIADKVGLFDEFEKDVETPRRYLPQTCMTGCRYRLFCEDNIANGNIVDECGYCRYKAYANENGVFYDNTRQLDIPSEDGILK